MEKVDITENIAISLRFFKMYADRFLYPLKDLALGKLRVKQPWLHYMTKDLQDGIESKFEKEMASIDPEKFLREKRYLLLVLKRKESI